MKKKNYSDWNHKRVWKLATLNGYIYCTSKEEAIKVKTALEMLDEPVILNNWTWEMMIEP